MHGGSWVALRGGRSARDLEYLFLHEDEWVSVADARRVLAVDDIEFLDRECAGLKTLKVDIRRGDDELPTNVLSNLATGFKNLRALSPHLDLGLADIKHPITPTINYASVPSMSKSFFDERRQSGLGTDPFTITLWTGSSHRRWPQWEPPYVSFEKQYTATYAVRRPAERGSNEVQVHVHVRHVASTGPAGPFLLGKPMAFTGCGGNQDFYCEKIRVFKAGLCSDTLAWNNRIGRAVLFCWFLKIVVADDLEFEITDFRARVAAAVQRLLTV
ncbi:hypothetical protein BJY00DRAFT_308552 [Aspergillus carlsbadensis]|nr:hypothetical protein BJY00DRAFT_308552 [Aspergillus carlsbadensis]